MVTLFDFNNKSNLSDWKIIDDVVMGGRSSGKFYLNTEGFGIFEGAISLENNGGFSSIRYRPNKVNLKDLNKIRIRLRGDGKNYQFRIKVNSSDYFSYIYNFQTTGKWEIIEIPLEDLIPSFRGRKLNIPNFSSDSIGEIGILVGNKKTESFMLILDKIEIF